MDKQQLLEKWGTPTKVGHDGHVRLVDFMGSDAAIVQAARVSYGAGTKKVNEDRQLIRYLMRHRHTTPLEMCEVKFHIRMPMDAHRQQIRHRTASVNEYSTRYSEAIDSRATTQPDQWRLQSTNNKQGSAGFLSTEHPDHHGEYLTDREKELHELAGEVYKERLDRGVAREQARKDLPLSTYTEYYWKMDLHNLFHYLGLRLHPHAQQEIREFAQVIGAITKDCFPVAYEAFEDYRLHGQFFSREEMECLHDMLTGHRKVRDALEAKGSDEIYTTNISRWTEDMRKEFLSKFISTKRERVEFWSKING